MPNRNNLSYDFGPFRLDVSKRVLTRAGETISLTPKATEILLILVENAGELVEKDELLKEVWPNSFVEEANLSQNIFTLRRALGDERALPRYIETVTRRGYRFIARVRSISADTNQAADAESKESAVSHRPVVAVLPFLNTTGDQEFDYLADSITENIINNLSRVSKLRVMSRSAVSRYKTKEVGPQNAGKELGCNTVLVGKVNSAQTGISIFVELVDVSTGWQLLGDTFNAPNLDILEIQEVIIRQLLTALKLELTGQEEIRVTTRYTENPDAYQFYLEGRYHSSLYTRKSTEKAIDCFQCAIKFDPNYALAYAGIIDCYLRLATDYFPLQDDHSIEGRSHTLDVGATCSDESDSKIKLRFAWDCKGAERELRRANELRTNYPSAHQWYRLYRTSKELYEQSCVSQLDSTPSERDVFFHPILAPDRIP